LKAASLNATQAQAMVKMADAGVNEIQNMVTRIQTLAIQASSANNDGELGKLDAERIKLESAINKIATSTNFNGVNLLSGNKTNAVQATGTYAAAAANANTSVTGAVITGSSTNGAVDIVFAVNANAALDTVTINGAAGLTGSIAAGNVNYNGTNNITLSDGSTMQLTLGARDATTANTAGGTVTLANGVAAVGNSAALSFQVGAENNVSNQVNIDLSNSYSTTSLYGAYTGTATADLLTQANAKLYIDKATAGLDKLITQRADLGATQNQVAFVQANLATSIEQTSASVSSIRDADMAAEMADFTKNKILTQASTSMLAQANQAAQNVLSLFR